MVVASVGHSLLRWAPDFGVIAGRKHTSGHLYARTITTPVDRGTGFHRCRVETVATMTIGALSRRTGLPVKTLREYEDLGLIYTVGRSEGNYRLFDEEALWCVAVVSTLRSLGLTIAEIQDLAGSYLGNRAEPSGPKLDEVLQSVKRRTRTRIADLEALLGRIASFEAANRPALAGRADLMGQDPRGRKSA